MDQQMIGCAQFSGIVHRPGIRVAQLQPLVVWRDLQFHVGLLSSGPQKNLKHIAEFPKPLVVHRGARGNISVHKFGEDQQHVVAPSGPDPHRGKMRLRLFPPFLSRRNRGGVLKGGLDTLQGVSRKQRQPAAPNNRVRLGTIFFC